MLKWLQKMRINQKEHAFRFLFLFFVAFFPMKQPENSTSLEHL